MNALPTNEGGTAALTSKERFWAAIAHLSSLITLIASVATVGIGGLPFVVIPLVIYLSFKDKSDYVEYQAMQAFSFQLILTVGFFVGLIAITLALVILWVVSFLLIFILVGFILIPVSAIVTVVAALALLMLPFAAAILAIMAGAQTAQGLEFSYPYMDDVINSWMNRNQVETEPLG